MAIPRNMIQALLIEAHDKMGHNGAGHTYALLKQYYYWKGIKVLVDKHVKNHYQYQKHNQHKVVYPKLYFDTASFPMEFLCMDLIGTFHLLSSQGHQYALTTMCMLTGHVFCEPLKTKQAEVVVQMYIDHIYCKFGGSLKILTDNGMEFKNEFFDTVAKELGVIHKGYTAPYHPTSNGRIEGFHNFLKACLSKHMSQTLEWDQVIPLACAA